MLRFVAFLFIVIVLTFSLARAGYAQTAAPTAAPAQSGSFNQETNATMGVAHMVQVKDTKYENGTVLSTSAGGAIQTIVPYDSQVIGVVSRDAAIIFTSSATENSLPVISTGIVYIKVSSKDGVIKKGDLITSSTVPGVAVKAKNDGFVLGSAMEDYAITDPNKVGIIAANLELHYFNSKPTFPGTLSDIFKLVLLPTKEGPHPFFKYIMAGLVVLGSMILGFMTFGRAAAKGVEAIGRNPAASRIIHMGIIFNVAIVIAIALAGLIVAFLILRL